MSNYLYSIFPSENFIDLGLYQYGWEQCEPLHSFGPASRNHYLFHYVLTGSGILRANNAKKENITYHVKSNQGFMIFPHQICTYVADQSIPWEYVWLEFDGCISADAVCGLTLIFNCFILPPAFWQAFLWRMFPPLWKESCAGGLKGGLIS